MLLVMAPWLAYNASRFEEPVLVAHTLGHNLSLANCDWTYSGARIGFADDRCIDMRASELRATTRGDASSLDLEQRRQGLEYARDHMTRLPPVLAARIGRAWGLFRPFQQMSVEPTRGTVPSVTRAGFVAYWLLAPLALVGGILLRRRRIPVFPILAFVVISFIAVATTFGYSRYRAPAEVSIVLLAAVAIDAGLGRWLPGTSAPSSERSPGSPHPRGDPRISTDESSDRDPDLPHR